MAKPESPRPEAPMVGDEREQLAGFLDFQRATVEWKAGGLTDEQARRSLVPSELTTVAGLLSHLRLNEEYWFGVVVVDGRPDTWQEILDKDPDAEFRDGLNTPLPQLIADYQAQCEVSRKIVAEHALDDVVTSDGRQANVRWVVLHMIEETARHAGHLDLLREQLDGLTGE